MPRDTRLPESLFVCLLCRRVPGYILSVSSTL